MADPSAVYTLDPPTAATIVFNDGQLKTFDDLYWLSDVKDLDVAGIRAPFFLKPLADGGYKPITWLEEPLHPIFEGMILIQSSPIGSHGCTTKRNVMYHALKAALRDCYDTPAMLSWTEPGVGAFSLPVFCEVKLERAYEFNYQVMTFSFGLFSEASQPTGP